MPDRLVQVSKRTGTIERVARGMSPVVELRLYDDQYVVNFELSKRELFHSERKTVDWDWVAYVVTPL